MFLEKDFFKTSYSSICYNCKVFTLIKNIKKLILMYVFYESEKPYNGTKWNNKKS